MRFSWIFNLSSKKQLNMIFLRHHYRYCYRNDRPLVRIILFLEIHCKHYFEGVYVTQIRIYLKLGHVWSHKWQYAKIIRWYKYMLPSIHTKYKKIYLYKFTFETQRKIFFFNSCCVAYFLFLRHVIEKIWKNCESSNWQEIRVLIFPTAGFIQISGMTFKVIFPLLKKFQLNKLFEKLIVQSFP